MYLLINLRPVKPTFGNFEADFWVEVLRFQRYILLTWLHSQKSHLCFIVSVQTTPLKESQPQATKCCTNQVTDNYSSFGHRAGLAHLDLDIRTRRINFLSFFRFQQIPETDLNLLFKASFCLITAKYKVFLWQQVLILHRQKTMKTSTSPMDDFSVAQIFSDAKFSTKSDILKTLTNHTS